MDLFGSLQPTPNPDTPEVSGAAPCVASFPIRDRAQASFRIGNLASCMSRQIGTGSSTALLQVPVASRDPWDKTTGFPKIET